VPLAAVAVPAGALCLGDGAEAVAARSGARAGAVASAPDPAAIARIGARMPADGPRPAPLYLRPPDAAPSAEPPPRILDDDAEAVGR
jgi:hypothetical protein